MTANSWVTLLLYLGVLIALARPLGAWMSRVYQGHPCGLDRSLGWPERLLYRVGGVDCHREMGWRQYAVAALVFNAIGFLAVYGILRLQARLPLNPQEMAAVTPNLSLNTAASFASNTNWQSYGGEMTLS
jgi:potassium-transporting ATPase potassium-binding subunit